MTTHFLNPAASGQWPVRLCCKAVISLLMAAVLGCPLLVSAAPIAWPLATLRPPGSEQIRPVLAQVALAGPTAVTAYTGDGLHGYRVYTRILAGSSWVPAALLSEGENSTDSAVSVSADGQKIAVGSALAAGGGRVAIYYRDLNSPIWNLGQVIGTPAGASGFGSTVSLRGDLLIVTSTQGNGAVYSFRYQSFDQTWVDAQLSFENSFIGSVSAVTDGERIAYCRPLSMSGCATATYTVENGWQTEALPVPAVQTGGPVLAVTPSWLFIRQGSGLQIYGRSGSEWQLRQQIPLATGFAFDVRGDYFVAATGINAQVFGLDGGTTWAPVFTAPIGARSASIVDDDLILVGTQAFRSQAGIWGEIGIVAGLPDLDGAYFGQVALAGNDIWVGAPGYASGDTGAGSIWIYPQWPGAPLPTAPELSPIGPALNQAFGAEVTVDGEWVALSSPGVRTANGSLGRVSIFHSPTRLLMQEIDLPDADSSLRKIAMAGDTLAISRYITCPGTCSTDVLVYRDSGTDFTLAQTIAFPVGASTGAQFGSVLRLRGDWLLSGRLMFKRSGSGVYAFVRELERPQGMGSWGALGVSRATDPLVVATWPSGSRIGLVYAFDDTNGWTLSGALNDGGFSLSSECLALDADVIGIGCVASADGEDQLFLATADAVGSDWSLVGSALLGIPALLPPGHYSLVIDDATAIVGRGDTALEPAGMNVGKVVVLTFDETIFGSGFE